MLNWYKWFSWWWARGCSKHVENWGKYIEKNWASSWSFTKHHNTRCFQDVIFIKKNTHSLNSANSVDWQRVGIRISVCHQSHSERNTHSAEREQGSFETKTYVWNYCPIPVYLHTYTHRNTDQWYLYCTLRCHSVATRHSHSLTPLRKLQVLKLQLKNATETAKFLV